jgi:hypothetical protein
MIFIQRLFLSLALLKVALSVEPSEGFDHSTSHYERVITYAYIETPLCALNLGFFLEFGQLQNFPNTLVSS